jgi:hypothetical protein
MPIVASFSDGNILTAGSLNDIRIESNNNIIFANRIFSRSVSAGIISAMGSYITTANDFSGADHIIIRTTTNGSNIGTGSLRTQLDFSGPDIGTVTFGNTLSLGSSNAVVYDISTLPQSGTAASSLVYQQIETFPTGSFGGDYGTRTLTGTWITGAFQILFQARSSSAGWVNQNVELRRN